MLPVGRPIPHAPDAGPGCAAAVRRCLRRPGPRPRRSAFLTLACKCLGRRSMMLRPLCDLPALDGGGHHSKVLRNALLSAVSSTIDDEQPRQRRIAPPGEEIVDHGFDDDSVGRRPLEHGQDMLVAVAIDADRRHQDMVLPSMQRRRSRSTMQVEHPRGPRRAQNFIFLRDSATKRRETADCEDAVATRVHRGRPRADGQRGGTCGSTRVRTLPR